MNPFLIFGLVFVGVLAGYEPVQTELLGSAIDLIERMCDLP